MKVYVVETGEYEQRDVFAICTSIERAVEVVKEAFGKPYRVSWELLSDSHNDATLRGHFEDVPGYSTEHVADYDITEWDLQ